jgi:hypothetical protein
MRAVGKWHKLHSLLIFNLIKKCQKTRYPSNWKIRASSFLTFLIYIVFVETWGANTLLGTVIQLFIPASVCLTYYGVFIESLGAHTLLGTFIHLIQLFILASVHLYTDKPAGDLLWNQYDIGRRGCALMSSLHTANWKGQTGRRAGGRAQVSIGMHAHPKIRGWSESTLILASVEVSLTILKTENREQIIRQTDTHGFL